MLGLPFTHVTSMEDVQGNFDRITVDGISKSSDNPLLAGNNLADLTSRATALANLGIARSNVTLTWSGGTTSATVSVAHGLAGTPAAIVLSPLQTIGGGPITGYVVTGSITSTHFSAAGVYSSTLSGGIVFAWVAIL